MNKILLLTTLAVALALPSAALASEPAEWYEGDLPAKNGEINVAVLSAEFDYQNSTYWQDFACDEVEGNEFQSFQFIALYYNCHTQGNSIPCNKFSADIRGLDSEPYKEEVEEEVFNTGVDYAKISTLFQFPKGCSGWGVSEFKVSTVSPVHATWENITPTTGKVTFSNAPMQSGSFVSGTIYVEGRVGSYTEEVGEGEYKQVYGHIPISIR